jgi:radical SAM protein with 4Fe4S-binding SPASM domain
MKMRQFILKKALKRNLFDEKGNYKTRWINFEFNSSCNLRCKWCSLDHAKKREVLSENILEKALDELIRDDKYDIERIDLHNAGETLLHPNLKKMLEIIASKKEKIHGKPTIHLLTNAYILNEKNSNDIIESGSLDEIRFSVDGGSKELYEKIRGGSKWELVRDNILNFLQKNKGKIRTEILCIIPNEKEVKTDWMEEDFKDLFARVDNVDLRRAHNWDGSSKLNIDKTWDEVANGRMCKFLLKNLVILPNGDVTVCCADLNSRGVVGNLSEEKLVDIFFSLKRLNIVNLFSRGKKEKIDLCKSCAGYYE